MSQNFSFGSHEILNCLQKPLCSRDSHLLKPAAVYPARRSLMVYRFLSKISLKSEIKVLHCCVRRAKVIAVHLQTHVISLSALKLSEVWNQFGVSNVGWSVRVQRALQREILEGLAFSLNSPGWHSEDGYGMFLKDPLQYELYSPDRCSLVRHTDGCLSPPVCSAKTGAN